MKSALTGFARPMSLSATTAQHTSSAPAASNVSRTAASVLALVQYVVEHQHGASGHGDARRDLPGDLTALRGRAVAGDVEIIELQREAELRQEAGPRKLRCRA
jgi:hypothetical protein